MLNKLLKYDLKYMLKNMSIFYILAILFSIVTRILFSLEQTTIIYLIGQICVGCMFSMLASILINVIMRSWVRFIDSVYKDESYLTHTLPVTKKDIYNSKFLQTLIFFIISFIVVIVSLLIAYYTEERWIMVKDLINSLSTGLNVNTTLFITGILAVLFLEIFNVIQSGFLGIILGHKKNNNKLLFLVIFGFVSYMISQFIVLIIIFITGIFNTGIMDLFKSNMLITNETIKLLMTLATISYLTVIILMNIVCKIEFNKGVNIE